MGRLARIFLGLSLLTPLLGCSEQVEQISSAVGRKPPVAPAPLRAAAVVTPVRYTGRAARDPFGSYVLLMRDVEASKPAGELTPLERFDLTQLTLQAIIWGTDNPRALVLDPSGKSYVIGLGSSLGKNDGRVVGIADNVVTIKETYVDFRGRATTKDIEMRLNALAQGG